MTITIALSLSILLGVWLVYMGATQLGATFPRWVSIAAGVVAILAGLLMIINGIGG